MRSQPMGPVLMKLIFDENLVDLMAYKVLESSKVDCCYKFTTSRASEAYADLRRS